jgi:Macrocin-O-methyltransferase (TylF)
VFKDGTSRFIAAQLPDRTIHGFDSFAGLPEGWTGDSFNFDAKRKRPSVPRSVKLHAGLFSDSLPHWLKDNPGPVAFLHIDSDLYASAKCVFDLMEDRIIPGTVIVFDEYFNCHGWKEG